MVRPSRRSRRPPAEAKKTKRKVKADAEGKGVARKRARKGKEAPPAEGEQAEAEQPAPEAAEDSEDDGPGRATRADREFIDDEGAVAVAGSEGEEEGDPGAAPQAEEADESDGELEAFFKPKSTRRAKSDVTALKGEAVDLVAQMEAAAEQDAAAREAGTLATSKLRLLSYVQRQLCRRELQAECMENHLLHALAAWLRPAPDGAMVAGTMRTALLRICTSLPLDTQHQEDREKLKSSGLGKVIMHLKLHDCERGNRELAGKLVDAWCRPIFALSAAYTGAEREEKVAPPRPTGARGKAAAEEADLDGGGPAELGPTDKGFRHKAAVPEPARLDYSVRPKSAVVAAEPISRKAREAGLTGGARIVSRLKSRTHKQNLAAHKVSVEGRGMVLKNER